MTDNGVPLVEARDLAVRFKDVQALDGATLSLRGGELVGLVGPNGAGKTTLLRTLVGLQAPDRGEVHLLGRRLDRDDLEQWRQIGFCPDEPPLYDKLTVGDYLRFVALGYGLPDADERIEFWLEQVWLRDKRDARCKGLSRGMRQRVGLARTLLPNPAFVVLDEPAAGLDPAGRVQFRKLLVSLREQGKAVVVSSHILADMADYCTHIAVMSRGRLASFEHVEHVLHGPGVDGTRRYAVTLARPIADLRDRLAKLDLAHDAVDGHRFVLLTSRDPNAAAQALATLVRADLPVAGFAPESTGLEEAYLRFNVAQVD